MTKMTKKKTRFEVLFGQGGGIGTIANQQQNCTFETGIWRNWHLICVPRRTHPQTSFTSSFAFFQQTHTKTHHEAAQTHPATLPQGVGGGGGLPIKVLVQPWECAWQTLPSLPPASEVVFLVWCCGGLGGAPTPTSGVGRGLRPHQAFPKTPAPGVILSPPGKRVQLHTTAHNLRPRPLNLCPLPLLAPFIWRNIKRFVLIGGTGCFRVR